MIPAKSPPKPKEKVKDVSLNIAQKLLEMPIFDMSIASPASLSKRIKRKEQENWKKTAM